LTAERIREAIEGAEGGPVEEGSVGAGTGTISCGWKAGIGTSSRSLPEDSGGCTIGVLVQSNFPGRLQILGTPIVNGTPQPKSGSIMIVIATDAPLSARPPVVRRARPSGGIDGERLGGLRDLLLHRRIGPPDGKAAERPIRGERASQPAPRPPVRSDDRGDRNVGAPYPG